MKKILLILITGILLMGCSKTKWNCKIIKTKSIGQVKETTINNEVLEIHNNEYAELLEVLLTDKYQNGDTVITSICDCEKEK